MFSAHNRVKVSVFFEFSGTDCVSLMIGTESVPETLENFHTLTRLMCG
jgi:hypothetical protein